MTGPVKMNGSSGYLGGKAYFDKLNEAGGIQGKRVEYRVIDDAYKPETTLENIKTFDADPNVLATMTDLGTANALAVIPYLEKSGFPFLFPIAGSDRLRTPTRDNIYLLRTDYQEEAAMLVSYAYDKLKISEFGVLYQSDGMGEGFHNGFMRTLGEHKLRPVISETYDRKTRNYAQALEQFLKLRPKAIYFGGNADAIIPFVEALQAKDYKPVMMFSSVVGAMQLLRSSIVKNQSSGIFATESAPLAILQDLPLSRQFKADMHSSGKELDQIDPQCAFEGYIAANVVTKALKSVKGALSRTALKTALGELPDYDLGGVPIHLNAKQHVLFEKVHMYEIKDAKPTEVH